jgi:hypothetical protein
MAGLWIILKWKFRKEIKTPQNLVIPTIVL